MVKLTNDTNQVQSPVDIAQQMLSGTQEIIFNSILGPQRQERVERIGNQPADPVIDSVLQDIQLYGQEMNLTNPNNVTAPDRPVPAPAPPPDLPSGSEAQGQQGMPDIMNLLGGVRNGNIS